VIQERPEEIPQPVSVPENGPIRVGKGGDAKRDGKGLFGKGNAGGPGRPPGVHFRTVIIGKDKRGIKKVEADVRAAYKALVKAAKGGDVSAIKLLLDRACEIEPTEITVRTDTLTDAERAVRLRGLLDRAESRMRGEIGTE
jgi:hypothetical protein